MRKVTLICLFLLLIFLTGCENTDTIEINLEYEEFIVVQANLIRGMDFEGVSITRTLPLEKSYSKDDAIIKDASAFIRINGVQIIPLHYNNDGTYKPLYKLIPAAGNTYELFAQTEGRSVYSITAVPSVPDPLSSIIRNNKCIEIEVMQNNDEVYGALWLIKSGTSIVDKSDDFQVIESGSTNNSPVTIRTQDFKKEYQNVEYLKNIYYKIFSFDKAYRDYFKTRINNTPIDNSLLYGGGSVIWNVHGDNVIGLFIGSCEGDLVKVR